MTRRAPRNASPELPGGSFVANEPEHLLGWLEASGDLWRASGLLPGRCLRPIVEGMLEAHLDDVLGDGSEPPEGAPRHSSEQVGNRKPEDATTGVGSDGQAKADSSRSGGRRAPRGDRGGSGGMEPGELLGEVLRSFPGSVDSGDPRARVFGRRGYRPKSPDRCKAGDWSVGLVSKSSGEWSVIPFRCRSWRCTRCAPAVNARDAARIEEALGAINLDEALFVTLTFDRKRYANAAQAWRVAGLAWKRLRDSLAYEYGSGSGRSTRKARIVYVQTWEQHSDGWPHVHALVWNRELAADARRRGSYVPRKSDGTPSSIDRKTGAPRFRMRWTDQVLRDLAVAAGFGYQCDAQSPRAGKGALAGYLVKIATELTASGAKDQTPLAAPKGFRRIRSTPKFLAPQRVRNPDYTGTLLVAPRELVEEELEAGAESFRAAMLAAKSRVEQWLRRKSVPNANEPSTREDSRLIGTALTG